MLVKFVFRVSLKKKLFLSAKYKNGVFSNCFLKKSHHKSSETWTEIISENSLNKKFNNSLYSIGYYEKRSTSIFSLLYFKNKVGEPEPRSFSNSFVFLIMMHCEKTKRVEWRRQAQTDERIGFRLILIRFSFHLLINTIRIPGQLSPRFILVISKVGWIL